MFQYSADNLLAVHELLLIIARNWNPFVQYHIVEVGGNQRGILFLTEVWFFTLLAKCVPEIVEKSNQEVYAG